jgi:hypothetical protein
MLFQTYELDENDFLVLDFLSNNIRRVQLIVMVVLNLLLDGAKADLNLL